MGSSIGIRMNHYKDSYEASSTMECNKMFFLKSPYKISQVPWTVLSFLKSTWASLQELASALFRDADKLSAQSA